MRAVSKICLVLCLMLAAAVHDGAAQVPRIDDAELAFAQALEAFDEGDYGMAYRRFRLVYANYDLNRKTTAAYLMAGKALFRQGEYARAVDVLTELRDRFPTTSYLDEAQEVLARARERMGEGTAGARVIDLGIALPLTDKDVDLTQALFNGIRLAVDEYNATQAGGPRVRMVFRDSGGEGASAAEAVGALVGEGGADLIIGPLYSAEARAAATAAERAGVVLVAPLATDEDVAEGRRFVFQANPTITMRGRQMARFARRSLRLDDFGIVASRDQESISERMAEGFQEEVLSVDDRVAFYELLETASAWGQLPEIIGVDALGTVDAVYLPVSGARSASHLEAALQAFERAGVQTRVLGNAEWHDVPFGRLASKFNVTYSNDFYVDEARPEVSDFRARYRELAGKAIDVEAVTGRLAITGYDVTRFLLPLVAGRSSQPLPERIRTAPAYEGLGLRLDFEGNVNEGVYFHRFRDGSRELVR